MRIRLYRPSDCGAMAALFYDTVHNIFIFDKPLQFSIIKIYFRFK